MKVAKCFCNIQLMLHKVHFHDSCKFYFSVLETAKDVMLETKSQAPTKTKQRQSVENVGRELQKPTEEHHDASSSIKSSDNRFPKLRQLVDGNFKVLSLI